MNVHPLAELIPAMTDAEYADLLADVKANGQLEPITLHQGKILDGRHRARACEELGLEPTTRDYEGDSPAAYVLSLNVKRRSLSVSQRAALAVEFLPQLEEEARKRQLGGLKRGTEPPSASKDADGTPERPVRAVDRAGELVGVSGASVDRAKRVKQNDPESYERVKAGIVSVNEAHEKVTKPPQKKSPTYDFSTGRGQTVAEANRQKLHGVCSALEGYAEGLDNFKYERALALASDEDKASWLRSIDMTLRALRGAKKAIEGSTQ